jgi:hypothetical protein
LKIKLDENIPATLSEILPQQGHDVDTVADENLTGRDDRTVWEAAQTEKRFFITQDLDFSDLRDFPPNSHGGLLLLRFRFPGRKAIKKRVKAVFTTQNVENWPGKFIVMTETKTRVIGQLPSS